MRQGQVSAQGSGHSLQLTVLIAWEDRIISLVGLQHLERPQHELPVFRNGEERRGDFLLLGIADTNPFSVRGLDGVWLAEDR